MIGDWKNAGVRAAAMIALLVAALAADQTRADVIAVSARDGSQATEIVMQIGARPFLVDTAASRQIDIVIPQTGIAFDFGPLGFSDPGQRIETARALLDETSSRIRLVLNCDCPVAAQVSGGALLVKIQNPVARAQAGEGPGLPSVRPVADRAAQSGIPKDAKRFASAQAPAFAPAPWPRGVPRQGTLAEPELPDGDASVGEGARDFDPLRGVAADEVELARLALIRQLARAADQGLLDFASQQSAALFAPEGGEPADGFLPLDAPQDVAEREDPATDPDAASPDEAVAGAKGDADASALADGVAPPAEIEVPLRARTAWDKRFRDDRLDTWVRVTHCADNAAFDFPNVPTARAFTDRVAALRSGLLDDFDVPNPSSIEALSRILIAHGFGAEAISLLSLLDQEDNEKSKSPSALLIDLAHIVDGKRPSVTGPLALGGPCAPMASVWFEAAGFRMDGGALERRLPTYAAAPVPDRQTRAMIDAFNAMPDALRLLLGPRVMTSRLNAGDTGTAELIDLILRRMAAPSGSEYDLARARLLQMSGRADEAGALYQRLAGQNLPEAWDALLRLADISDRTNIASPSSLSSTLADALGDAALLARDHPAFRRLKVAEIRMRVRSDGLGPALDQVADALRRAPEDGSVLTDAAHAALEWVNAAEDDPLSYAKAVMTHADLMAADPAGDQARRKVASELTRIGLGNAALIVLAPAARRAVPALMREEARAWIALGDGAAALRALGDMRDPAAMAVRSEALIMLDRPADAFDALSQMPDPDAANRARLGLLSGNWAAATQAGPAARRILAAGMARSAPAEAVRDSDADRAVLAAAGLSDLMASTPETVAAVLDPARIGPRVTLRDAGAVIDGARTVRELIEEALPDG